MKTLRLVIAIALVNALFLTGGILLATRRPQAITPENAPIPSISPSSTPTVSLSPTPTLTPSVAPSTKPTSTPTTKPTAAPTPDNRCLIQIDGVTYNVTVFRTIHGGGDIFQCGTDMSTIFHNQHSSSYLDKMQKYRI